MSFYKKYPNRKDWRKQYHDSRRFDGSCRCHGSCSRCKGDRTFFDKRRRFDAEDQVREYYKEVD